MSLKITIDGTYSLAGKTGIGEYVKLFLINLQKYSIFPYNYQFFYNCIFPSKYQFAELTKYGNKKIFFRLPRRWLMKMWNLPYCMDFTIGRPDIFVCTGLHTPRKLKAETFSFIYDISFLIDDVTYSKDEKKALNNNIQKIIDTSKHIIATSESTKKDLINYYKIPADNISVIYGALGEIPEINEDLDFINVLQDELAAFFYNSKSKNKNKKINFFLFVGTIEKRKNLIILPEAVKNFKEEYKVIIVGKKGNAYVELLKKIEDTGTQDKFIFTGYISDEVKYFLYKNCLAVLYPSIYEGFGFPALEAFNFNKYIITTRNGSIPEIAGDCGLYIKTNDAKELSEKMQTVFYSEGKNITGGSFASQLKKFSWKKSIVEFEKLITDTKQIMNKNNGKSLL